MAVVKTKHFRSTHQTPKQPPDGSSLEEQMNAFLATLPLAMVMDVQTSIAHSGSAAIMYSGVVVYQA